MFKDKALFIPFILLHIGQWIYTMNMPLFVTNYLRERDSYVGYLASLCAGLEVPFMVILGILSAKFPTRTLLLFGSLFGGAFYFSIGVFKNFYMMLAGQVFLAIFLAILLGLGISYFQDILPDFRLCLYVICECNGYRSIMWKFIRWRYEPLGWFGKCLFCISDVNSNWYDTYFLYKDQK